MNYYKGMKRILLIEDDSALQTTIGDRLCAELYDVTSVTDGSQASFILQKEHYDLIICDLMLPKKNGLDIVRDFRKKNTNTPILILTAKNNISDKVLLLRIGANDYMTKPFDFEELLARIEVLLRTPSSQETQKTEHGDGDLFCHADFSFDHFTIVFSQAKVLFDDTEVPLSLLEFKILAFLVQNRNRIVKTQALLDALWGESISVGVGTIYTHISWLRKKICSKEKPDGYIKTIRSVGYVFEQ